MGALRALGWNSGGGGELELMLSMLCSPEGAGERSLQGRRLCPGHPEVLPGAGQAQGQAGTLHKQGTGQWGCSGPGKPQTFPCYTLLHVLEPLQNKSSQFPVLFQYSDFIFYFYFFFINVFFRNHFYNCRVKYLLCILCLYTLCVCV